MTYAPQATSQGERSGIFAGIWAGTLANMIALPAYLLDLDGTLIKLCLILLSGSLFIATLSQRYDDHFAALRNFGQRCGMAVVGLWLFAFALIAIANGGNILGALAGSNGAFSGNQYGVPAILNDGLLLAITSGLAFHLGFAFSYWKGPR